MDVTAREGAADKRPAAKRQVLFESLARQHYAGVYSYLRYVTRDAVLAEDLTQETFMQVWQHLPDLRRSGAARVWVYRVARNQYLQHRRRAGLETVPLESCDDADGMPASEAGPQVALEREALRLAVRRAVEELPDLCREVVVLHNLEQLSLAQVAQVLEVPIGTVKSRRARAFTALRRLLQQEVAGDEV
jgi:RNA polymerase sigma-70 factor (ECF subfamily)